MARYRIKSTLGRVRAYYGLTQEELADYLSTSVAVLGQAETAEHLGRSLPFAALVRFTELLVWQPAAAQAPARLLPPDEAAIVAALAAAPGPGPGWPAPLPAPAQPPTPGELEWRQRVCLHQATGLSARLAPLELRTAQADRLRALLAALPLPGAGAPPTAHPDPELLAIVLAHLARRAAAPLTPAATLARQLLALRRAALRHEAAAIVGLLPPAGEA